jgi:signal transduction histidine kinase
MAGATSAAAALSLIASLVIGGRPEWLILLEGAAMIALIFLVLRRVRGRPAVVAVSLAVAAEATMIVVGDGSRGSLSELAGAAGGVAFWSLGAVGAAGAALHLNALDAERERSVAEARRSQRLEVARDLHDFVAHDVSAILVQAQAGRMVPEDALSALERIEVDAQRALAAMDRTVQALRDASGPEPARTYALEDLSELAGRFATSAQAKVRLDVGREALDGIAQEVSATGYRVVVEALTNVRRHAPAATEVEVALATADGAIAITVTNDGVGDGTNDRDSGFGLIGLRERVHALGGTLTAGPVDGDRWRLRAVLPR